MAKIGKNILDNLTTGMYSDSKVIYREYIQNACDQIDKAVNEGLISVREGLIDIYFDIKKRYISIEDNATGVSASKFIEDLGDIANSNKEIGKDKGFRGIGRLCGLAYCKTLVFTTSYKGESVKSIMTCDAKKMRDMLYDSKKYTIDEIWERIVTFKTEEEDINTHYFRVELININEENTDLLDEKKVKEYLSFVAPVPYSNKFYLRNDIYNYTKENNLKIDEYLIKINGAQIFKEYTTKLKDDSGNQLQNYDEIYKLKFESFTNSKGELIAWMWYGLSRFEKQIPACNLMRGIRVRTGNIQIGENDVVQKLFKESRGNFYFVGEIFTLDKNLIPNSQRDYFNENPARIEFEDQLRIYFYDNLHKLYYDANRIKNAYKKQEDYLKKVSEYEEKNNNNGFIDEQDKISSKVAVEKAKKEAENATKTLKKYDEIADDNPLYEVKQRIENKYNGEDLVSKAENTNINENNKPKKESYITNSLSKLSRNERKIVSKIFTIITDNSPEELAKKLIDKITEELK